MPTTDPTFTYIAYLFFFFICLSMKDNLKHQRQSLMQQQKIANQGIFYTLPVPINNHDLFEKRNTLLSTEIFENTCNSGRI